MIDLVQSRGGCAHIPAQRDRKEQRSVDPAIYRKRDAVERCFCKLEDFLQIATRFDELARHFLAAVLLASTHVRLRLYEPST